MPFDGVVTKCVVDELNKMLAGGRIEKIHQPEPDEIIMLVRSLGRNFKLLLSASPSFPRIHITEDSRENPQSPPMFCMLLRKHLGGGKITGFEFHNYERMITIHIEAVTELGDLTEKKLIIEIMGRHSNIILVNNEERIIDAIKHVDNETSSVREVMPARQYVLPPTQNKTSIDALNFDELKAEIKSGANIAIEKFLLNKVKGFSPLLCREICHRSGISPSLEAVSLSDGEVNKLCESLGKLSENLAASRFSPCIILKPEAGSKPMNLKDATPIDFHCFEITHLGVPFSMESVNSAIDTFYSEKDRQDRLKQKKADILKVVNTHLERCRKKKFIHEDNLREAADRERLKLYGELITSNIYCIPLNAESIRLLNYYSEDGEYVDIPLDPNLNPQQNAQMYFKRYSKAKSTHAYALKQLSEINSEIEYFESVLHNIEACESIKEIDEIRQELAESGCIAAKAKQGNKKKDAPSSPIHYTLDKGYDVFVGRNNIQNDYLTLKAASSNDIWLHTKNIPGSHVIIKKKGPEPIPDDIIIKAARIAAYHSKAKFSSNVPVDYTQVKNVKKPNGAKPGMVIYENYKTVYVTPIDIHSGV